MLSRVFDLLAREFAKVQVGMPNQPLIFPPMNDWGLILTFTWCTFVDPLHCRLRGKEFGFPAPCVLHRVEPGVTDPENGGSH
jgi:hypothetical protein